MFLLIRLWACLTGRRIVVLLHWNGDVTYSIAYANEFGQVVARVWWPYSIYNVVLLSDGTTRGFEPSCYVKRWKAWTHNC